MKIILQLVVIDVVPSCNYSHIKEKEKKFKKNEKCGCNVMSGYVLVFRYKRIEY